MSALRQPNYYYPQTPVNPVVSPGQKVQQPTVKTAKVLKTKAFPVANTLPKNLKTLSLLQKGSFAIAIATMTASISLYASTVKIPKLWSQEYQHLEDLQLQERQLVAINETIKYQIAQEAAQNKDLSISKPESAIFINPAQVKSKEQSSINQIQPQTVDLRHHSWGY